MAKLNLNELIAWLKADLKNRFEIYNVDKEVIIEKCASYADLTKNFSTPIAFFEDLADKGVRQIQVTQKLKNGSTYIRKSCGLNFTISTDPNDNVAASGLPDRPAATPQQTQPVFTGLGNPSPGYGGLGLPEIMAMRSQADRFEDLKVAVAKQETEKDKLLAKIAALEADNKNLERQNLTFQLGKEAQPSALDKFVEAMASNPGAIPQIIQSFKGPSAPALNGPQLELGEKKLSDIKSYAVDLITNNSKLSDEIVNGATHVLVQAQAENEAFVDEFVQLLQKYKL